MRTLALWRSLTLLVLLGVAGCQPRSLVTAPYLMRGDGGRAVFDRVDPALRTPDIPVLYVTDRAADRVGEAGPEYGFKRSARVDFGVATVALRPEPTWDQLVADSTTAKPSRRYPISVRSVERLGTFRPLVEFLEVRGGRLEPRDGAYAAFEEDYAGFNSAVTRWLEHSEVKDAYVFVHGYNNTFSDAVYRMAESWHYGGRQGVPIVYTWPAGSGGLKGYAYDRESGEFTIVHLKLLLLALARCPQVERIHVISHSRGTDVATTALRELHGEVRAATGRSLVAPLLGREVALGSPDAAGAPMTWEVLKLRTLVLAAPDLDLQVFAQRYFGENMVRVAERTVIYFSEHDKALGLADWLFRSTRRVGALKAADVPPETRALLAQLSAVELVNCRVKGTSSHAYVFQHPAAFSDLILLLRHGLVAGAEHGRPLIREAECIWRLPNDYLSAGWAAPP